MDTQRTLDVAAAGLGLGASVASWMVGIPFPIGAAIGAGDVRRRFAGADPSSVCVARPGHRDHRLAGRGSGETVEGPLGTHR